MASFEDLIYELVKNNNFEFIIECFKIEMYNLDFMVVVLEVGKFFVEDVFMLGLFLDS